ncbi:MAG: GNAT family N-acetyltransferase [Christensenellaceae bacterium]|jgi:putative acetyltransferase|nr:GNAT family N-acetyltransferase [Christensenellaceae bacterium]
MEIRQYIESDAVEIWRLFHNTIHTVNAKDYTVEQLNAWSPAGVDVSTWAERHLGKNTIVAFDGERLLGFGDINKAGYLSLLYVHINEIVKGIGMAICNESEKRSGAKEIKTYASITAVPFFEKRGYKIIKENEVERNDVAFRNYTMKKVI